MVEEAVGTGGRVCPNVCAFARVCACAAGSGDGQVPDRDARVRAERPVPRRTGPGLPGQRPRSCTGPLPRFRRIFARHLSRPFLLLNPR